MIAVDTSAVITILWREPDGKQLREKLSAAGNAAISVGTVLELQLVTAGAGMTDGWDQIEALFGAYRIAVRPFGESQLRIAREAALRFGKGRHKASLNFGDCFAYALAKSEGLKLLCKCGDFAHTDLELA